jgi:recombination protein RecR
VRFPAPLDDLIRELSRLPGIGPKSAQRLAFHLLARPAREVEGLAEALLSATKSLDRCPTCGLVKERLAPTCAVCDDPRREAGVLCIVEQSADALAIERSGAFAGRYHVLHGALSPMRGIGPDQLNLRPLWSRLSEVREVILATATTVEGEATAAYLARELAARGVASSRIAYGLPVGGDLEYADEVTLGRAMQHRRPM